MRTPSELEKEQALLASFRDLIKNYRMFGTASSMMLYYPAHTSTQHQGATFKIAKEAIMDHFRMLANERAAELKVNHNVDVSSELPW